MLAVLVAGAGFGASLGGADFCAASSSRGSATAPSHADNLHELAVIVAKEESGNATIGRQLLGSGNGSLSNATPAKLKAAYDAFVRSYARISAAIDVSFPSDASPGASNAWSDVRQVVRFELAHFRALRTITESGDELAKTRYMCAIPDREAVSNTEDSYRLRVGADIKQLARTNAEFGRLGWSAARTAPAALQFSSAYTCLSTASEAGRELTRIAPKLTRPQLARWVSVLRSSYGTMLQTASQMPDSFVTRAFRRVASTGAEFWAYEQAAVIAHTTRYTKRRETGLLNADASARSRLVAVLREAGLG
jgi:hypothetical protein